MTFFQAIILGIVEGLTEFLPVSSTAHMEIAAKLLGVVQSDFLKSFEIIIQFGAILAVLLFYGKILYKKRSLWKPLAAAFIPTAVIGFILYKVIKGYLLGNLWIVVATLALGGAFMIWFEWRARRMPPADALPVTVREDISVRNAFFIGLAQALAVVPGVSRSAATILAGRAEGIAKETIVEFSFLLAVPTLLAAAGYDLLKNLDVLAGGGFPLLIAGFLAAFFSACAAIALFLSYVRRRDFTIFGIYRICAAALLALYLLRW